MIKWCSYCHHYICECEPWDDFQITHGVCQTCFQLVLDDIPPDPLAMQEIKRFFRSMQAVARSGTQVEVDQILQESDRLRLPPIDLMLGILQPLLVQIGLLWEAGRVTVAEEHRFSALADQLLAHARKAFGASAPDRVNLILFNAEGNDHCLGLMMAEYFFTACGIATQVLIQGLPDHAILDLLDSRKPDVVGFSVALAPQMQHVRKVAARIRGLPDAPRHVLVGGPALRMGLDLDPSLNIQPCYRLSEALPFLAGVGRAPVPVSGYPLGFRPCLDHSERGGSQA